DNFRSEGAHQLLFLHRKFLWNGENDAVPLADGRQGEPNPSVASRRFDNRSARLQFSALLSGLYEGDAQAVFDAAARIEHLQLGKQADAPRKGKVSDAKHRRVPYQIVYTV